MKKQQQIILPDINYLGKNFQARREKLGWTQVELTKRDKELKQSDISKIERQEIKNPSYSTIRRIHTVLVKGEEPSEIKAKEIMTPTSSMHYIEEDKLVIEAIKKMRKYSLSQLPVRNQNGDITGSISEKRIREMVVLGGFERVNDWTIKTVKEGLFPQIDEEMPISLVSSILNNNQAVLITKYDKISGIITNADFLKEFKNEVV